MTLGLIGLNITKKFFKDHKVNLNFLNRNYYLLLYRMILFVIIHMKVSKVNIDISVCFLHQFYHSTYRSTEIRFSRNEYFMQYLKFYAKKYEHKMRNADTFILNIQTKIILNKK